MYERMLDGAVKPSTADMVRYCGGVGRLYTVLNDDLATQYGTGQEIRFPYGKRYGWCVTHRIKKKLICDVFAEAEAFTVMLRLSDEQFAAVYPALTPYAQNYVDRRYPCGNGGWIHYRIACEGHLRDILILLGEKCK